MDRQALHGSSNQAITPVARERETGPDVDIRNLKATPSDTPPTPKPHLPILPNSYHLRLNRKACELLGGILIQTTFQLSLIIALYDQ